jgi:hypothetical protein
LWTIMDSSIKAWISNNISGKNLNAVGLRVLIALADGTVCYDSDSKTNTYSNFLSKTINENHNSRIAILQAILSNNGVGFETKLSTTTNTVTTYLAQRIWPSNGLAMGTIRVSINAIG